MQNRTPPATASEILGIIGAADDGLIIEIINNGATAAEVLEVFTWMNADDQLGTELERGPRGATIRVMKSSRAKSRRRATVSDSWPFGDSRGAISQP